jgi:hypothetical protein
MNKKIFKCSFWKIITSLICLIPSSNIEAQIFIPFGFLTEKTISLSSLSNIEGPEQVQVSQQVIVSNKSKILTCSSTYFSATSSDTTVLSLANITFSGTFPTCYVNLLTTVNSGTSTVTLTVKNEWNFSVTQSFLFTAYQKPVMAFAFRKIIKNYLGSAIRVRRISDNVQSDIGFDINGNLDLTSYVAFQGGSSLRLVTWYDQSGNNYNATQATPANQPAITTNGFNGAPQVEFSSTYWLVTTQTQNIVTSNRDLTVFFASKATTQAQTNMGSWNTGNSSDRISIHVNWSDNVIYWDSPGLCCANSRLSVGNAANVNQAKVYVFGRQGAVQYIKINGTTVASRSNASGTYGAPTTSWYLGTKSNNADSSAPLAEYVQYLAGLSDNQVNSITNEQKSYFGL